MLVAYSLGLGVPFVAAGLALGRLTSVFAFVKRHFRVFNLVVGPAARRLRVPAPHQQRDLAVGLVQRPHAGHPAAQPPDRDLIRRASTASTRSAMPVQNAVRDPPVAATRGCAGVVPAAATAAGPVLAAPAHDDPGWAATQRGSATR